MESICDELKQYWEETLEFGRLRRRTWNNFFGIEVDSTAYLLNKYDPEYGRPLSEFLPFLHWLARYPTWDTLCRTFKDLNYGLISNIINSNVSWLTHERHGLDEVPFVAPD